MEITIRKANTENLNDLINICIIPELENNEKMQEGILIKKKYWKEKLISGKHGAFIAYIDEVPAGNIHYVIHKKHNIAEVKCIYIPGKKYQGLGIGRKLFEVFLDETERLDMDAIVVNAFEPDGDCGMSQIQFFEKLGFRRFKEENRSWMYYKTSDFDEKALIDIKIPEMPSCDSIVFFDGLCPWCSYFTDYIQSKVRELKGDIDFHVYYESEEDIIGVLSYLKVNGKFIQSFVLDNENFCRELQD